MNTNSIVASGSQSTQEQTLGNVDRLRKKTTSNDPECRLEYVCEALGINKGTLHQVTDIDFVLDDVCRMDFLSYFSNLKSLTLINQGISEIEGLEKLVHLEQMWLSENHIENIKGLDKLKNLKDLFISTNRIKRVRGLDHLVNLEKLWLDENKIETLENAFPQSLINVRELNVAGNRLETIGMSLDSLISLEELNISQNRIGNFKEVLNLNRLPNLRVCTFQDPHYGDNPICNLCNYQTFVLYHQPNLQKLDTLQISDDAKAFADATFMKKRMYYNMRIKTIQRNASNVMKLLKICKKIRCFKIDIQVTKLTKKMNEITRELEERQYLSVQGNKTEQFEPVFSYGPTNSKKNPLDDLDHEKLLGDLEGKKALIQGRVHDKNEDLKDLEAIYESLRKKMYEIPEQNIHRLLTELETGGNIRFEEGKPTDKWFQSCNDLAKSRFNPEQMKFFGITGINVTRVTRIHNRFLRNRFEEKLEQLVDLSDVSYKRSLEYLFYGLDPYLPSEMYRAMEEGFRTPQEYQQEIGLPISVSLVNSVASAEIARINSFFQGEDGNAHIRTAAKAQKQTEFRMSSELTLQKGLVQIPSGQILVCKVFLSKCVPDQTFPYFNPSHSPSEIWRYAPVDVKQYQGMQSVYRTKENDQRQRMWFVLDNALILPEYLVEFEYVTNVKTTSSSSTTSQSQDIMESLNEDCNKLLNAVNGAQKVLENTYITHAQREASRNFALHLTAQDLDRSDMGCLKKTLASFMKSCHIEELAQNGFQFLEEETHNSAQLAIENSMPPEIPVRSKIDDITEFIVANVSRERDFSSIVYLNLFSNRIKKIKCMEKLINLNTLILSFNEIDAIEGLQECKVLKRLDLNHNFIRRIENLEGKGNLQSLNLTNNWISEISHIDHLRIYTPSLRELSLKCNPISAKKSYRSTVFFKLPSLTKLDQIAQSEKDKQKAQDILSGAGGLNREMIIEHVKNQIKADITGKKSSQKQQQIMSSEDESGQAENWERMIENIILSHKRIQKIEHLEPFINLRKLQLNDNCIVKVEGLSRCKLLEELSLEKNKIINIEGINHLRYLKKLDLGCNRIRRIDGMNQLESLTQLSLEDNEIQALDGLDQLQTLMELYLGNNIISDLKEIVKLKALSRLIILDISGNSLSSTGNTRDSNYRIYCIFHLKKLKVLDGVSVESTEHMDAKETFAGRLTDEILESRLNNRKLSDIKELDLSSCRLRDFDNMFDESLYPHLRDLNLSHNSFVTLRGFGYLPKLKILKIKANRLETLFCKPNEDGYPKGLFGLPGLEVLDVSYNNLHDLYGLQYSPLKDLKILNVSNNEIVKVDFLEKLKSLRELDLSKNRIRQIDQTSFQNYHLITCLRLEDNGLRNLQNCEKLERLQSLFASGNRLAEFWEVDRFTELPHLMEISLLNNPMTRKPNYRTGIIKRLPALIILDGKEITPEERQRVEQAQGQLIGPGGIQTDPKAPPMIHFAQYPTVKVPVKLNAVNFDGVFNNMKMYQGVEQPTPIGNQQQQQQMLMNQKIQGGISGIGINGQGLGSMGIAEIDYQQPPMSGLGIQSNDKNSNTRRPSTKTNASGGGGNSSTGVSASSQSSITQKDKNLGGGQKTQYGGGIKPPMQGQVSRYPKY